MEGKIAPLAFRDHFPGIGIHHSGRQTQQRPFARALFPDNADHGATGGRDRQIAQRRKGHAAKLNRHAR